MPASKSRRPTSSAAVRVIGRVDMGSVSKSYRYALMLPQSETERLLEERFRDLGVAVERQVELIAFKNHPDGIEAVLRHLNGRDAPFTGETLDSDRMLADVHMTGYPGPGAGGFTLGGRSASADADAGVGASHHRSA